MVETLRNIFNGRAMLAPMLGTTDIPFRKICREAGAGLLHTEMVSTLAISRASSEAFRHAIFDPSEGPVAIQLVASSPDTVGIAIRELLPLKPAVFDINCGCPNSRICEAGAGAALLDRPEILAAVIRSAVDASTVPVSVKLRAQGHFRGSTITENARIAQENGATYITVHGRSRSARYDQHAHWDCIGRAKHAVDIPVVGNGDIFSAEEALRMQEFSGCDAVMIARGSLGTPWIFDDYLQKRTGSVLLHAPAPSDLLDIVLRHAEMIEREFGPVQAIARVRKHVLWYTRYFQNNDVLRRDIFLNEHLSGIRQSIIEYFASEPLRSDPESFVMQDRERSFRRRVLYWMEMETIDA